MKPWQLYNKSLDLLEGNHIKEDDNLAFKLNEKAALQGDRDAILAMGWFYAQGIGVDTNYNLAIDWYKKSARQKEPKALASLGQIELRLGNYSSAIKWLDRAIKKGHKRSYYHIGKMYYQGLGVKKNLKKAINCFEIAAKHKVYEAHRFIRFYNYKLKKNV